MTTQSQSLELTSAPRQLRRAPSALRLCLTALLAGGLGVWSAMAAQDAAGKTGGRGARRGQAQETRPGRGGPQGGFRTATPAHPYDVVLGRPTDNAVTVSVLAGEDGHASVRWGTATGDYPNAARPATLRAGEAAQFRLDGLRPDAVGHYQVLWQAGDARDWTAGPDRTFRTQRPPGTPFTFALQADSHLDENTDPALYLQTLRNVAADRPDFLVDLGDTFMTGKYGARHEDALPQYLAQRWYFGQACDAVALFLVLGNHDGETAGRVTAAVQMRTRLYPNPIPDRFYTGNSAPQEGVGLPQDYYAWTWGEALFIVLDPYLFSLEPRAGDRDSNWGRTLGREQYDWLKATLESSRARFRFVFIHHLVGGLDRNARGGTEAAGLYEWGGHDPDGTDSFAMHRPGWPMPIHQLLVAHGVSAVFHGHDHFFARQERDGLVYQLVPQPGHPGNTGLPRFAAGYGYGDGDLLGGSGHLRVRVDPDEATVDYVLASVGAGGGASPDNGRVAFSYALAPRPAAP